VAKLIILSIVLVSFGLPVWFSSERQPRRALRRTQQLIFFFVFVWAYLCLHWYPALVPLK
jgi:hypothetical protein